MRGSFLYFDLFVTSQLKSELALCLDPPDLNTVPCLGAELLNVGYGDLRGRFLDLSYSGNYGVP